MLTDWELWACAHHCLARHGEDAAVVAALRADALHAAGNGGGARTWQAVVRRIDQLVTAPSGALH